jgi:hypothetical protein
MNPNESRLLRCRVRVYINMMVIHVLRTLLPPFPTGVLHSTMLLRTFTLLILGTVLLVSALPERPTPDFDSGSLRPYDYSEANQHLFEFNRHWDDETQRQDEECRYPGRPHFPSVPPIPAPENRTIYQVLSDDPEYLSVDFPYPSLPDSLH